MYPLSLIYMNFMNIHKSSQSPLTLIHEMRLVKWATAYFFLNEQKRNTPYYYSNPPVPTRDNAFCLGVGVRGGTAHSRVGPPYLQMWNPHIRRVHWRTWAAVDFAICRQSWKPTPKDDCCSFPPLHMHIYAVPSWWPECIYSPLDFGLSPVACFGQRGINSCDISTGFQLAGMADFSLLSLVTATRTVYSG